MIWSKTLVAPWRPVVERTLVKPYVTVTKASSGTLSHTVQLHMSEVVLARSNGNATTLSPHSPLIPPSWNGDRAAATTKGTTPSRRPS